MSNTIGTPDQINESAFDELALFESCKMTDWPELMTDVVNHLRDKGFFPSSLNGRKPGPGWLMKRLVWLVKTEMDVSVRYKWALWDYKSLVPWWHECLTIAMSLATEEKPLGRKSVEVHLSEREFSVFWCLAELRFYLWSFGFQNHASALKYALQALEGYPRQWQQSFSHWWPDLIKESDSFVNIALGSLWLAVGEQRPLVTTLPEVATLMGNSFARLRGVRLKGDLSESDNWLIDYLRGVARKLDTKANRNESPKRLLRSNCGTFNDMDLWIIEFHHIPRKPQKKRGKA